MTEQELVDGDCRRQYDRRHQQPALPAIAAERISQAMEQREDQDQTRQQPSPIPARVNAQM